MPELIRIEQADKDGWEWAVLVIQPGLGANGQYFPPETLRQATPKFDGARVFCLPDGQHSRTGDKSAQHIVGWLSQAAFAAAKGITARLTLTKTADWLRQNLLDAHTKGQPSLYGLSVDAPGKAERRTIAQGVVQWFTEILDPVTVDVVWNPGTPGGFQRALNAVSLGGDGAGAQSTKEDRMDKEKLIKILQAKRPDLLEGKDLAAISMEDLTALLDKALAEPSPAALKQAVDAAAKKAEEDKARAAQAQQASRLSDDDRAVIQQAQVLAWNGTIAPVIAESKLPEVLQASLRKRFMDGLPADGQEAGLAAVKQAIDEFRKVVDSLSREGRVEGLGFAHSLATTPEIERLQQAMDRMFGLNVKGDVPAFAGIRQAYARITGDTEVSGYRSSFSDAQLTSLHRAAQAFYRDAQQENGDMKPGFFRVEQAQMSGTWPLLLGNTLFRRLVMDYGAVDYGEDRLISTRRRANDFRTIESIRMQYAADLPTVNPEIADYTEAPTLGEEGVNYVVATRGRIMTVSRKTIINDDLQAVIKLPQREGRAARRTFARTVWNLWISNGTYDGDAVAWFHASHSNLGSTALTADAAGIGAVVAALNRLVNQTEPGSSEKLAGSWKNLKASLIVPNALQDKAYQLNQSNGVPGAANQGDNPIYHQFGSNDENPERIVVCPLLTDATDWGVVRNPADIGIIEVAFLRGQEAPEVFVADNPQVGQMFMADKLQYKIRHEYGADIEDYRGADKSAVAG